MSERREYFRVPVFARVRLRALSDEEQDAERRRLHARAVVPVATAGGDDPGTPLEGRTALDLLRRIAVSLERLERRVDRLAEHLQEPDAADVPVEISLSGSGFAGRFGSDARPGVLFAVELDLSDSGLPLIHALARCALVGPETHAFSFDEIHPEDRERIVQFALRSQSQMLRRERSGESR